MLGMYCKQPDKIMQQTSVNPVTPVINYLLAVRGSFLSTCDCVPSWVSADPVLHTLLPSAELQGDHELGYAAK